MKKLIFIILFVISLTAMFAGRTMVYFRCSCIITLAADAVTRIVLSKKVTVPLVYDVRNVLTGEKEFLKVELKH